VYVPDAGWIEFEPTSNRAALNYGEAQSSPATPSVTLPVSQPQFNWLGLALIALATLALGWMLWRFTRQPHIEPAARLYWRVRRALAWAGLRGSVTTTPDEFTASLTAKLAGRATLSAALAQATALYERALYGSRRVNGDEAWRVEQLWRSARWEWLAVWVRELGARLRRK
jgi:transglutaminase-like putative cysteine protease